MKTDSYAISARRAYIRKWRAEHPERVKEYARRYWEKKGAQLEAELKARKDTPPEGMERLEEDTPEI